MAVYYNENDPKAAAWLRFLIREGHLPDGFVDTRSITEVQPHELKKYTQCHFFAGIGGWSLALFLARWPATKPVWTGSCPCQPFSDAGKGLGTADERHLWPHFFRLIRECRPAIVFGEQVASKAALAWLDGVFADLESAGYTCGAADLCAACVGAPQIRQRLHWVAYSKDYRPAGRDAQPSNFTPEQPERQGTACGVADTSGRGFGIDRSTPGRAGHTNKCSQAERVAHADGGESSNGGLQRSGQHGQQPKDGGAGRMDQPDCIGSATRLSGQDARQEGQSGIADHAGDKSVPRERERERDYLAGAVPTAATGRTLRA